jgi:hypothetical protein
MPVLMGVRGQLDRLFTPAGSPRTLFVPAGINFEARENDVVTIGANNKTDAIWSIDQWDQYRFDHTNQSSDRYLEVHGFEANHDQLIVRGGKGDWPFFIVEEDVDLDGRKDLILGRYNYDTHGGKDEPNKDGFYDIYVILFDVTARSIGLDSPFAGGRFGDNLYWASRPSDYPSIVQVDWYDPLAAEYEAEVVEPEPEPEPEPGPGPDGGIGGGGSGNVGSDRPDGNGGGQGQGGGGSTTPLIPLDPAYTYLDPFQRLTLAVASREPITSWSKKRNRLTGTSEMDVIQPWRGQDIVTGLGSPDAVLLNKPAEFGKPDRIVDFEPGVDHLFLTGGFVDHGRYFSFSRTGEELTLRQAKKGARGFVYDTANGWLYFNENGRRNGWGDGGLALLFDDAPLLSRADFTVS